MTTTTISGLEQKRRKAAGSSNEDFLVAWLNNDDGNQWGHSRKDHRQIISLLEQFAALREQVIARGVRTHFHANDPQLRPINQILERYPSVLTLMDFSSSGDPVFLNLPTRGSLPEKAISIMYRGLIDRLRRCALASCRRWFFARRPKGECCSDKCAQKNHRSSQEYKKHNREYMRGYYRDVQSPAAARNVKPIKFKKKARSPNAKKK